MNHEIIRSWLYFLGLIPSFLFALRMIVQWLQSEQIQKSVSSEIFWKLSLAANSLYALHSLIQMQFPICAIQTVSAVLSWRNLQLIQHKPGSKLNIIIFCCLLLSLVTIGFCIQSRYFFDQNFIWARVPLLPGKIAANDKISAIWPMVGYLGTLIFALRFIFQWLQAEENKISYFSKSFWVTSLIGASLALTYFLRIHDWLNVFAYGAGILPYFRNLQLSLKN